MESMRSALRISGLLASVLSGLLLLSCIERSNPFDPVNQRGVSPTDIIGKAKPYLDSLAAEADALGKALAAYRTRYRDDSAANAAILAANQGARADNDARLAANIAVETYNQAHAAQPDSLRFQGLYRLLDSLAHHGPYAEFASRRTRLQLLATLAANRMSEINLAHFPKEIFSRAKQDSVLAPFVRDTAAYGALQAVIDSANGGVTDTNAAVAAYNAARRAANSAVTAFNEDVAFRKLAKDRPVIDKPDSLRKHVVEARPGDTLLVGAGTLAVDLRFASGTRDSPIVVKGSPGLRTILRPARLSDTTVLSHAAIVSSKSWIRFEDLVFRGGANSGIKLEAQSRGIAFHRCRFDSSVFWGLEVVDSDVEMTDCEVVSNGGGVRISVDASKDYLVKLDNVLVAQNRGHGLDGVAISGTIARCTFADNGSRGMGSGIVVQSPLRNLSITHSIFASNTEFGILRQPTSINQNGFVIDQNDFWANGLFKWSLRGLDSARLEALEQENLEVDPLFQDPSAFDYTPRPGSALAEFEKPPLPRVIGYRRKR